MRRGIHAVGAFLPPISVSVSNVDDRRQSVCLSDPLLSSGRPCMAPGVMPDQCEEAKEAKKAE